MVHTCASSAALVKYLPPGQVFAVQTELSVSIENLPEEHGTHDVSVDAEPATDPTPAAHDGLEWDLHGAAATSSEYVPIVQPPHTVSVDAEPATVP